MSLKVKNYSDLSDLEKLSLVDFSYSRIDTYTQCPSKYFYSYISKEPRQFAPAAVLGNIVHEVFENVLENDKPLDIEELKSEYSKNVPKWDPLNQIPQTLLDAGNVILDEFYDQNEGSKFNIYAKEMGFELVLGSYVVRGFIDRVDLVGDRVNIIDYKTGKWEVATKDIPTNLQLGVYALAASLLFPDKEIYAELYYLRSGRRKGHLFTKEDIDLVKENLIKQMSNIINDLNFTPTNNGRICSFCDHAKSGACATGAFRNKKNNR